MNASDAIEIALRESHEWIVRHAEDLADAPMTMPTPNGGNHPTWVVGHLAAATDGLVAMVTGMPRKLEVWDLLFGRGTEPLPNANTYPAYKNILEAFATAQGDSLQALREVGDSRLDEPPAYLPDGMPDVPQLNSKGTVLLFIAIHNMAHLGQLADARQALGRVPFG